MTFCISDKMVPGNTNIVPVLQDFVNLAASQAQGGIVEIEPSIQFDYYTWAGQVNIPSNVCVRSEARIRVTGSSSNALVVNAGSKNVSIRGFHLDVNGGLIDSTVINVLTGCENVSMEGVLIEDSSPKSASKGATAISIKGCNRSLVRNCSFHHVKRGVWVRENATNTRIVGNTARMLIVSAVETLGDFDGLWVEGNRLVGHTISASAGHMIATSPTFSGRNLHITGNTVQGNPDVPHDESINGASGDLIGIKNVDTFILSQNIIADSGEVGITVSRGAKNGIISGNVIRKIDSAGIYCGSPTSDTVEGVSISNNLIQDFALNQSVSKPLPDWALAGILCRNTVGGYVFGNTLKSAGRVGVRLGVSDGEVAEMGYGKNAYLDGTLVEPYLCEGVIF